MPPPPPPPLPPPPLPPFFSLPSKSKSNPPSTTPQQEQQHELNIPPTGPPNTILVSLLIYNGWPFADHWEYFIASPSDPATGVVVQAAGDVRAGFWLEVKRGWRFGSSSSSSSVDGGGRGGCRRVRLGWVAGELFSSSSSSEGGDCGKGVFEVHPGEEGVEARCGFERVLFGVPVPGKTLRAVDDEGEGEGDGVGRRTRITQRNCQTWVVESAEQLVREGIFEQRVVDYLRAASIMTA